MELAVRLFDKYIGDDLVTQATSTGEGDVIAVMPDGFQWSEIERTTWNWIIMRVPISAAEANAMLSQEQGDRIENPLLWTHAFRLDLYLLRARGYDIALPEDAAAKRAVINYYDSEGRIRIPRPTELIDVSAADFNAAKLRMVSLVDEGRL